MSITYSRSSYRESYSLQIPPKILRKFSPQNARLISLSIISFTSLSLSSNSLFLASASFSFPFVSLALALHLCYVCISPTFLRERVTKAGKERDLHCQKTAFPCISFHSPHRQTLPAPHYPFHFPCNLNAVYARTSSHQINIPSPFSNSI